MSDPEPHVAIARRAGAENSLADQKEEKTSRFGQVLGWRTLGTSLLVLAAWLCWTRWDGIIDARASVDDMQKRVAISVASPTVHTRERLLNDRFEQVSWLDRELDLTNPSKTGSPATDPKLDPEKPKDAEPAALGAFSATSRLESHLRYGADDPRQLFELVNGYRDVLRAERARAMLDDRHDVDNNTLDLFSFDAAVMPRGDARGYAAVEVVLTREPKDLLTSAKGYDGATNRHREQKDADQFDTYIGWLEKVRDLQRSNLESLTYALDNVELPGGRSDYDTTLRIAACSEYMLSFPTAPASEDERREACRRTAIGNTPYDRDENWRNRPSDEARLAMRAIDAALGPLTEHLLTQKPDQFRQQVWPYLSAQLRSAARRPPQDGVPRSEALQRATALDAAAANAVIGEKTGAEIARECMDGPPESRVREVDVMSPAAAQAMAGAMTAQYQMQFGFSCGQIPRNASWRMLFAITSRLGKFRDATESLNAPERHAIAANPDLQWGNDMAAVPTSCVAAALLEESLVRPTAEQPRNHGTALVDFFTIRVERLAASCSISVQPKIRSLRPLPFVTSGPCPRTKTDPLFLLCRLDELLEGPGYGNQPEDQPSTRAYGYSLSPRLRQNVEIKASQNDAAGVGDAGAGFAVGRSRGLYYRGVEPEVVGFERPITTAKARQMQGARFGWLISPRPGRELTWSVPLQQAQLSAVVALPSWWRSALLQVCVRFLPERALAELLVDTFWAHGDQCRVEMIRLPGSAADISRRLGMDVLTTPYMESWKSSPVIYAGSSGEPTHLLITGERLWRNTVVTLGGQKADRIEVLPDMVGITATFDCVRKPMTESTVRTRDGAPARAAATAAVGIPGQGSGATDLPFDVPVIVWTSEGHTHPQNATVVVRANDPFPPCHPLNGGAAASAAPPLSGSVTSGATRINAVQPAR